jgi:Ca-activated chloride channel family protein
MEGMRITVLLLALGIAFPLGAGDTDPTRILFLVDASASMATSWPGRPGHRMGSVRTALDGLAGVLAVRKVQPVIAIRVFGDQLLPNDLDACGDTRNIRQWAPASQNGLSKTLDSIHPRGSGSLALALSGVRSDLGTLSGDDLVLIVLDGIGPCRDGLQEAFDALTLNGEGADIHIFGLGLDVTDQAELAGYGSFHAISGPNQLLQSMAIEISKHLQLPLQTGPIALNLDDLNHVAFEPETLIIQGTWTDDEISVNTGRENSIIEGGLGSANVTLSGGESSLRLVRIPVDPERPLHIRFSELIPIDLSGLIQPSLRGEAPTLEVRWKNAPDEEFQIVLQPKDAPDASWYSAQAVSGPTGRIVLPLPLEAQNLLLQFRKRLEIGDAIVAEILIPSPGREVSLTVTPSAEPGTAIEVNWEGPSYPGDILTLVPADAPPEFLGPGFQTVEGSPSDFLVPFDQCRHEIRYIDGISFHVLARSPVEVEATAAGLMASPSAHPSEDITVHWWGPGDASDVITLAARDADGADYIDWASVMAGSPARLRTPKTPGNYELRYVDEGHSIMAALPVTVEAVPVTLDVADTVQLGRRLKVAWTGPNGSDDFLIIVREGQKIGRHKDFTYVSVGSPTSLAAPSKPGIYEVQYIAAHPRRVLASTTVKVIK